MGRYVVGVTGASGTILAIRLLRLLTDQGNQVALVVSEAARETASHELSAPSDFLQGVERRELVTRYENQNLAAPIASGSYPTDGMVVIPCSMATLAALSIGLGDNLLRRAADVTLKERRPLILVPRETPLHAIHLENLLKLSKRGAIIFPPVPAWYSKPTSLEEMENFLVGRVCDQLRIPHQLYVGWGAS